MKALIRSVLTPLEALVFAASLVSVVVLLVLNFAPQLIPAICGFAIRWVP